MQDVWKRVLSGPTRSEHDGTPTHGVPYVPRPPPDRRDAAGRRFGPPAPARGPGRPEVVMLRALSRLAEKVCQILSDFLSRSQRRFWL